MPILDNIIGHRFFEKGKPHRKGGAQNHRPKLLMKQGSEIAGKRISIMPKSLHYPNKTFKHLQLKFDFKRKLCSSYCYGCPSCRYLMSKDLSDGKLSCLVQKGALETYLPDKQRADALPHEKVSIKTTRWCPTLFHVRFWEELGVKFPRSTRLISNAGGITCL
jgi:hypothetical protein